MAKFGLAGPFRVSKSGRIGPNLANQKCTGTAKFGLNGVFVGELEEKVNWTSCCEVTKVSFIQKILELKSTKLVQVTLFAILYP